MGTINVDFFQVEIFEAGNLSIEILIQQILNKPKEDRVFEIRSIPIWLDEATIHEDFIEGDFIRLGMTDIPVKGNIKGFIETINLADNEGLGVQSAFLYHIPTRIFLLQSKKSGISYTNFSRYLSEICRINKTILIHPVLQLETLRKLETITDVRKIEIRVAGLDNLSVLDNDDYAIKGIKQIDQYFKAPYLSLELSVGKSRDQSLIRDNAINFMRNLIGLNSNIERIKKLKISGVNEEEESLYLDLLKDRMRESVDHNFSSRTIPYKDRKNLIKAAWERRESEILKMYPIC